MARLRAQYCVLTRVTRQHGSHPTSDLLGVDYYYTVPADTEFPRRIAPLELFVRLFGTGRLTGSVRVTITRLHPDGSDRDRIYWKVFRLPTAGPGPFVLDLGFKLHNVVVPGEAVYAVRVSRRTRPRWDGARRARLLATDHVRVTRVI